MCMFGRLNADDGSSDDNNNNTSAVASVILSSPLRAVYMQKMLFSITRFT